MLGQRSRDQNSKFHKLKMGTDAILKIFYRYISAGNHQISMKFGVPVQNGHSDKKSKFCQCNMADDCHIENSFFGHISMIYCPINVKFGRKKQNHTQTQVT